MKSERNKAYKKSQTIKNKLDNKELTLLLSMVKENNIKLNKIDEDINSNPFTKIFKSKTVSQLFRHLISFLITTLVMILILVGLYFWIYQNEKAMDRMFDILGNGFYWILAGLCYFGVDYLIVRKGWFNEYAKR